MFKINQSSKVNLLFFLNNDINPRDYFLKQNEINNKNSNNIKINKKKESDLSDDKINSPQNLFSFSKESSNSFSELEENKEIKEINNNCEEFIFPLPDFDIFDYSKLIQISTQDDDELYYEKKEKKIDHNEDDKSTCHTSQNENKIELIKKGKIVKNERKRNNNFNDKNRKSSSKVSIRERSRNKI